MDNFDARKYDIKISQDTICSEKLFVARVSELRDLVLYGENREELYDDIIDSINEAKIAFDKMGREFPLPMLDRPTT